jgi:hypothetical protein
MSENNIKVSVGLDTKEFDKKFSEIMRKVQELARSSRQFNTNIQTGAGPSNIKQAEPKQVDTKQQDRSFQALQKTITTLTDRTDTFNKSLSTLSSTLAGLANNAQQAATNVTQVSTAQQSVQQQTQTGGGSQPPQPPQPPVTQTGGGFLKGIQGFAKGVSEIASIAQLYGEFEKFKAELPGRQAVRDVDIARSTSQFRERALQEQSFEDITFAPERAKAVQRGGDFFEKAQDARELRGKAKGYGGVAGLVAGLGFGAASLATGGILPALLAAGSIAGGMAGVTSEEGYYTLTGNQEALQKMTGQETMEEMEKYRLQEIYKDPAKYAQSQFLKQNRETLSRVQKSTGLTDEGMFGEQGFVKRGSDQFLFSQRAGMQQEIVNAGGTLSGQSNLHLMALQAQRNLGLTNSGQAMGRLTNYLNQQESEEAFTKIMAKGFSIGLDDSDYREETKDFLAQVTAIAQRMGGGQEMVAAKLTAGLEGDISRRSVEKSAQAFETLNQYKEETGGIIGSTKFRLINEDPFLNKVQGRSRLSLQKLTTADIEQGEKNPVMRNLLREIEQNSSEEERQKLGGMSGLQKRMRKMGDESMFEGLAGGAEVIELSRQAKQETDPVKKQILLDKMASAVYSMGVGASGEQAGRISKEYGEYKEVTEGDKSKFTSLLTAPSSEGIEKQKQAEAKTQSVQYDENLRKNLESIFENAMKNVETNLTNQLKMQSFNEALGSGKEAVEAFLGALKQTNGSLNVSTQQKPIQQKPIQQEPKKPVGASGNY